MGRGGGAGLGGWGAGGGGGLGGFGFSGFGFSGFSGFGFSGLGFAGFGRAGGRAGLAFSPFGRSPRPEVVGMSRSAAWGAAASSELRAEGGCPLRRVAFGAAAAGRRRSALRARVARADGVAASATNGTLVSWTIAGKVGTTFGCAGESVARAQSQADPLMDVTATATFAATASTMSSRLIICASSSAARRIPASA